MRQEAPSTVTAYIQGGDDDTVEGPSVADLESKRPDYDSAKGPKPVVFRRDSEGFLRAFDAEGRKFQSQLPGFDDRFREALRDEGRRVNMDLSQKSALSLSPTQENSSSAYAHFNLQAVIRDQNPSNTHEDIRDNGNDQDMTPNAHESAVSKQHHSAVTDSTANTYKWNDTGHVNLLAFLTAPENLDLDESMSQDASFAPRLTEVSQHPYEPQTPAPPVNPFSQKGSVMKGHEMFGATQPSSVGIFMASPTSSRPSPDVFNNSSPQKRMTTSPLEHRGGDEISPLRSSSHEALRAKSPPPDVTPHMDSSRSYESRRTYRREPRDTYISSKKSQERRHKAASASSLDVDSDADSDMDIPAVQKLHWRKQRQAEEIQRVIAQVTSARPGSGSSGVVDVEVPSTGRRGRSIQEGYVAQSCGTDARDTQQDDEVITDSQALVEESEAMDPPRTADISEEVAAQAEPVAPSGSSPRLPTRRDTVEPQRETELCPTSPTEGPSSAPKDPGSPIQNQSLPLQEVFTNRYDLKTPTTRKNHVSSDGADPTIPNTILETSPLGIRPMGDVTGLSFSDKFYEGVVEEAPGFTQDVEFDNAINPEKSPTPPGRVRARERSFPSFKEQATATETPVIASQAPQSKSVEALDDAPKVNATGADEEAGTDVQNDGAETKDKLIENAGEDDENGEIGENAVARDIEKDAPVDANAERETNDEDRDVDNDAIVDATAIEQGQAVEMIDAVTNEPDKGNEDVASAKHTTDKEVKEQTSTKVQPQVQQQSKLPTPKRGGLRSKDELRGTSKALRRSEGTSTPKTAASKIPPSRITKSVSTTKSNSSRSAKHISGASSALSTHLSSLAPTPASIAGSSRRKKGTENLHIEDATPVPPVRSRKSATQPSLTKEVTVVPGEPRASRRLTVEAQDVAEEAPALGRPARSSKRKYGEIAVDNEEPAVTRSSKRPMISHTTGGPSNDSLTNHSPATNGNKTTKKATNLFQNMYFAISHRQQDEKSLVSTLITEQGGGILEDGFEKLFETASVSKLRKQTGDDDAELVLSSTAKSVGFTALIADEHSRKAKYMQALALGLPCISGKWILTCVAKEEVVAWTPYLLCAGQSAFLGNAIRSRTMTPYPAIEATFPEVFAAREKLLRGKSVLLVTAKGKEEMRKPYIFLTRVLGPARIGQVADHDSARRKLVEDDTWDLLYVDKNESAAEAAVFGQSTSSSSKSRKRKKGPTAAEESGVAPPKKIRVISDEVIIQSLILGQLLED